MAEPEVAPKIFGLDELLEVREATERLSAYLNKRLKDHLNALSTLLVPGRVLGKHVGARESAPRADEALAELTEKYKQACNSLPGLKPDLEEEVLTAIGSTVQLYPYEYSYEAKSPKATRQITMTSPVRWAVAYGPGAVIPQLHTQLQSANERRTPAVRQFVINALAFQVTLGRSPGAMQLIRDLRYDVHSQGLPGVDGLPLLTLGVPLPSFRPADELLLTATRLSGVPAFIELIDPDAVNAMEDPLRIKIASLLKEPA